MFSLGTPLLLIFGYSFHFALIILLPTSILISLLQLKDNFINVDINFYKKLIIYCIPFIIISLYYSGNISTQINYFIGIFLVIISLKNSIQLIDRLFYLLGLCILPILQLLQVHILTYLFVFF